MLPNEKISGKELANGPIVWFHMEMLSLAWLFILGIMEELGVE